MYLKRRKVYFIDIQKVSFLSWKRLKKYFQDNIFNTLNNSPQGVYIRNRKTNKSKLLLMKVSKDNKEEIRVLTIEELKGFDGLSDLSDEQAKEMIIILKDLSLMAHKIVSKNEYIRTIPRLRKEE